LKPAAALALMAIVCAAGAMGCGGASSASSSSGTAAPLIRLNLPPSNPAGVIEVTGLAARDLEQLRRAAMTNEAWSALFRVSVKLSEGTAGGSPVSHDERPAMLGSYGIESNAIRFTPRFPFDPGRSYEVVFDPSRLPDGTEAKTRGGPVVAVVSRPKLVVAPSTRVEGVYPGIDVVPENQLRLYIHFSAPMSRRGGLENIHLLDQNGQEVKGPFLPLDADFWNDDRTRYTVFFDPGRVKRGLLPRRQMGPSLEAGRRYTLVVDAAWLDGDGLPLMEPFRREFRVGPPDERPLDPKSWRIAAPAATTRDPLVVTFHEPLDHGLLLRALGVTNGRGRPVDGEVRIEKAETRWLFTPDDSWQAGDYSLVALSILEDLAGNRIGRAFEVDRFDEVDRTSEPDSTNIPFRVR